MKALYTVFFLIKINYPSNNIEEIRYYNEQLHAAMSTYCFLDVEYDLTQTDYADLEITPEYVFENFSTLGLTYGNMHQNPKYYMVPTILLNGALRKEAFVQVLRHELFHFFGGGHSIDPTSLMYPDYDHNLELTRTDTLILYKLFNK